MGNLEIAIRYHSLGLCIIPIADRAKEPPHGITWKAHQTTRPTDAKLRRWFGNGKGHGLAVVLGEVSGGLLCRDFDDVAAYDRWAADFPNLAKSLPTVETGRPGRHVYCRGDVAQIRAASGTGAGTIDLGNGEVRGTGAYCLLPPSRHPRGHVYRWIVPLNGDIPFLDLNACGFLNDGRATESTEDNGGRLRNTDAISGGGGEPKKTTTITDGDVDPSGNIRLAVEKAVLESLPAGVGRRNRQVFELARALKAVPCLADADPRDLEAVVREWHRQALPFIGTEPFEETWIDFLRGWPRVKYAKGSGPMAQLFAKAVEAESPQVAERYEQPQLKLLLSLCRELQRAAGDGPFYLSVRTAARLLAVDPSTAWRWLFLLEHDRILDVVTRGDRKEWRASRFRYVAESKN